MKSKKYWQMSPGELAAATKRFDEPFVIDQSRPLTPEEKEQWRRLKRKRGRPKTGQGFERISLSIERSLLKQASALAKKRRIPRSKLCAQAIASELAKEHVE